VKRLRAGLWVSLLLAGALAAQGCATTTQTVRPGNENGGGADAETDSYRQGIRDTLAKLQRTGGLPVVASPRQLDSVHYVGPVMQEVWMPAQVVGGMVIPAHRQWVVVRPGTWQIPGESGSRDPATAQPAAKRGPF
jgi:hypothetical protein